MLRKCGVERDARQVDRGQKSRSSCPVMPTAPATIKQVTLERTMCFGMCPVYTVRVNRRGRFEWIGESFVPLVGHHSGEFPKSLFGGLSRLIDQVGFFGWDDSYIETVTDNPATILTVEVDGITKSVRQEATDKPEGLQLVATFIDGMVAPGLWEIEIMPSR